MTALGSILGVVLFVWGIKGLIQALSGRSTASREARRTVGGSASRRARGLPADDLSLLRERFATSDMTVEDFEAELEKEFEHPQVSPGHPSDETHNRPEASRPATPVGTARWEIHVHDAPPSHHLHLHLP